jgi:hypothetical protein
MQAGASKISECLHLHEHEATSQLSHPVRIPLLSDVPQTPHVLPVHPLQRCVEVGVWRVQNRALGRQIVLGCECLEIIPDLGSQLVEVVVVGRVAPCRSDPEWAVWVRCRVWVCSLAAVVRSERERAGKEVLCCQDKTGPGPRCTLLALRLVAWNESQTRSTSQKTHTTVTLTIQFMRSML